MLCSSLSRTQTLSWLFARLHDAVVAKHIKGDSVPHLLDYFPVSYSVHSYLHCAVAITLFPPNKTYTRSLYFVKTEIMRAFTLATEAGLLALIGLAYARPSPEGPPQLSPVTSYTGNSQNSWQYGTMKITVTRSNSSSCTLTVADDNTVGPTDGQNTTCTITTAAGDNIPVKCDSGTWTVFLVTMQPGGGLPTYLMATVDHL